MTRCIHCNSLLTRSETVCQECGSTVVVITSRWPAVLLQAVSVLFVVSLCLTVLSLFINIGASPVKGLLVTAALLFLKRSAADYVNKAPSKA
jgi:hypothetical protein